MSALAVLFPEKLNQRAFVCGVFLVLLFGCSPSNQARNYTKHISELKDNFPRLRVFPDNVREDAINPYFFYNRGFAQGGIILRLSYQLPLQEVKEVLGEIALRYTESSPQKVNRHFFGHFPIDSYEPDQMIPDDFRVFLIDTDLAEIRERPNHNQLCAIAVSEERNTVAYLFDSW